VRVDQRGVECRRLGLLYKAWPLPTGIQSGQKWRHGQKLALLQKVQLYWCRDRSERKPHWAYGGWVFHRLGTCRLEVQKASWDRQRQGPALKRLESLVQSRRCQIRVQLAKTSLPQHLQADVAVVPRILILCCQEESGPANGYAVSADRAFRLQFTDRGHLITQVALRSVPCIRVSIFGSKSTPNINW